MAVLSVRETSLFYTTHGAGPPIVCMHGGLGLDHSYLREWLDPLGSRAALVYYDHRGNGRSERPPSLDDVDHATWVEDAEALRAALGHDKMVLLGHSHGSFLALEYAARYPQHLAGLVLVSAVPRFDYVDVVLANAEKRAASKQQLEILHARMASGVSTDADLAQFWTDIGSLYFHRSDSALLRRVLGPIRFSAAAFAAGSRCLQSYDVTPHLASIAVPTLVLAGRHDWIAPVEQGADRLAAIPGAKRVVFEESGHFPFIEENALFLRVVEDWLQKTGLAAL